MAQANRRNTSEARKEDDARKAPGTGRAARKDARSVAGEQTLGTEPLRAAVDNAFRTDEIVRDAVKSNLKSRTLVADSIAKRAKSAFADFSASSYSKDQRDQRTYLSPKDDLAASIDFVVNKGAHALRHADTSRGIRLARSDALDKLIKNRRGERGSAIGTIDLDDLVDYITQRLGASPPALTDPACCPWEAGDEAERRLAAIEASGLKPSATAGPAATDGGPATDTSPNGELSAAELAKSKVNLLMDTMVSPEKPIRIDPVDGSPGQANEKAIGSVQTFELRDGPADVTSYHDFNSLQIAFQHVWTELFDRELESLGRELYHELVRLKDFAGLDDGKDTSIGTVADLTRLITEIEDLSRLTQDELPGGPAAGRDGLSGRGAPAGAQDLGDVVGSVLTGGFLHNDVLQWLLNPAGAAVDFLSDLFAGKQQANWASFEAGHTLPGGIDVITTTFEENAVREGTVEIVLTNAPGAATWKGIDFYELDATGRPTNLFKIANDPRDKGVWSPEKYNRLPLFTQQVRNGVLEFGKEIMFGAHKAHYFLIGLDEKLKDRTRVTFNWQKDK